MTSAFIDRTRPKVIHYVKNLEQAANWYRDNLGFEIGPHDYHSFVELFMDGEYVFHLSQGREGLVPLQAPIFQFSSRDIEKTYAILQSRNVEVGPMSWYPDYSSFTFRDLEGNEVGISQSFEIRFSQLEELLLVGFRLKNPQELLNTNAIPHAAHELKRRFAEISHTIDSAPMIGAFKTGECSDDEAGYWVCVQITQLGTVPEGMLALRIPAQKYAVNWFFGHRSESKKRYAKMQRLINNAARQLKLQAWNLEIAKSWGELQEVEVELDLYVGIS
ncbi:effector binding domain-containing protein [Paenibacillus psychroresistens]|nr:effector binding domain-containing protein [Paenibacillus psychroresistens]